MAALLKKRALAEYTQVIVSMEILVFSIFILVYSTMSSFLITGGTASEEIQMCIETFQQ